MNPKSRPLLQLTIWLAGGLLAGVALGLLLGWVVWPAEFTAANPNHLEESYQKDYLIMIAATYALDEDLASARSRLASVGRENVDQWLLTIIESYHLNSGSEADIRQLVKMATALGLQSPAMEPYQTNFPGTPDQ